jgi:hypothetical protein
MCEGAGVAVADGNHRIVKRDLAEAGVYFGAWLVGSFGYSIIAVYVLGIFEPRWGMAASAQVSAWILTLFGCISSASFLFAHARFGLPIRYAFVVILAVVGLCVTGAGAFMSKSAFGASAFACLTGFFAGVSGKYFVRWRIVK